MQRQPPVVRVSQDPTWPLTAGTWPMTVPAVAQLVADGLDLEPGVTFLVGENGSGKSTLVEAVAMAYGMSPEGGSTQAVHSTRPSESPLAGALLVQRGIGSAPWGFFLRAETMHGWFTFLERHPIGGRRTEPVFHEMSHGESFLGVLGSRFDGPGFYCLDEPEAALSFTSTLTLMGVLADVVQQGAQVLCATHSPVLASLPGATLLEVSEWGLRPTAWEDLQLVGHWRSFLAGPGRYLRHLLDDDTDDSTPSRAT